MCLLVDQKEGTVIEDSWIHDFYRHNADGVGVMWAEGGVIHIVKQLPATKEDLVKFFREHIDGKECAWHLRMRTHGDTDLDNCHPYQVFSEADGYPIYLMHNGVLHTGNKKDITKSDTWHFINDIIRPALLADPTQFMSEWFKTLIEEFIGANNKFVMMDAYGNSVTFNRSSGVTWRECWFSNTYAWSAPMAKTWTSTRSPMARIGYGLDDDEYDYAYGKTATSLPAFREAGDGIVGGPHTTDEDAYDDEATLEDELYAEEATAEFFEELLRQDMHDAYDALTFEVVRDYFLDYESSAWSTYGALSEGTLSEAEILEMFCSIDAEAPAASTEPERLVVGLQ